MDTKLLNLIVTSSSALEIIQLFQPHHFGLDADAPNDTSLSLVCEQKALMHCRALPRMFRESLERSQ